MNMNRSKGYSLVELAMVLVIIALLFGAAPTAYMAWKERAEELATKPISEETFDTLLYELKTGKPCPKKGLVKGNGKKIGLLKFCPDTPI
jgi:prepilin-type N-terminal cleavage/methylation domain-containing protein